MELIPDADKFHEAATNVFRYHILPAAEAKYKGILPGFSDIFLENRENHKTIFEKRLTEFIPFCGQQIGGSRPHG